MSTTTINNESIRSRWGRVEVSKTLIDQIVDRHGLFAQAAWNALMQDFVIMRADRCAMTDTVAYEGMHPKFEALSECYAFALPCYEAQFSQREEAHNITTIEVTFIRRPS